MEERSSLVYPSPRIGGLTDISKKKNNPSTWSESRTVIGPLRKPVRFITVRQQIISAILKFHEIVFYCSGLLS